jgi:hypothetical protein
MRVVGRSPTGDGREQEPRGLICSRREVGILRRRSLADKLLLGVLGLTVLLLLTTVALAVGKVAGTPRAVSLQLPAIVYVCGYELCRVDPSGGDRAKLTSDGTEQAPYASPSLTRDGRWLAFVQGGRAYVARSENLKRRASVDDSGSAAAVSIRGDGRELIVTREEYDCPQDEDIGMPCQTLYETVLVQFDGDGVRVIATIAEGGHADWLGDRVVASLLSLHWSTIYAFRPQALSWPPDELIVDDESLYILSDPAVSPDQSLIAATRDGAQPGVALYSTDTGKFLRELAEGQPGTEAAWSPDGKRIVFRQDEELLIAPVGGGFAKRLGVRGREPTWGGSAG